MEATSISYQLIAQGFVALLNLIMVLTLGLNYLSSRKNYLKLACVAGVLEAGRVIPNLMLGNAPDSVTLILFSLGLQFAATLVFLAALLHFRSESGRNYKVWVGALFVLGCVNLGILSFNGLPDTSPVWMLHNTPLLLLSALMLWNAWRITGNLTLSKLFLVSVAAFLLLLRIIVPMVQDANLFYLLYYIETLTFPVLLSALNIFQVEMANQQIRQLLETREQSEQDLKFIIDNSLDVILIADHIGLIKSWNQRGTDLFGYSNEQVIDKMHMDELFADNHWHKNASEEKEFYSRIEHVEGTVIEVEVRMRSVTQKNNVHSIFVIKPLEKQHNRLAVAQ